jgi:plasmid stabilization system protein ParE
LSRSLRFHPEAETDLGDAADHYALQGPGLDQRFIAEIELALAQIVAFPEASSPVNARSRRKILLGYPY